jgi:hypothetical protein
MDFQSVVFRTDRRLCLFQTGEQFRVAVVGDAPGLPFGPAPAIHQRDTEVIGDRFGQ